MTSYDQGQGTYGLSPAPDVSTESPPAGPISSHLSGHVSTPVTCPGHLASEAGTLRAGWSQVHSSTRLARSHPHQLKGPFLREVLPNRTSTHAHAPTRTWADAFPFLPGLFAPQTSQHSARMVNCAQCLRSVTGSVSLCALLWAWPKQALNKCL